MWALIIDGVITALEQQNPAGRFHPDLIWVVCPTDTQVGDRYDGSAFSRPVIAAPTPAVPQSVSMVQAQFALLATPSPTNQGKTLLDDVNALVDASTDDRVKIAWGRGTVVERDGLFVAQLAAAIPGLDTEAARDALFVAAAKIVT